MFISNIETFNIAYLLDHSMKTLDFPMVVMNLLELFPSEGLEVC
jgi:hypothetical protein